MSTPLPRAGKVRRVPRPVRCRSAPALRQSQSAPVFRDSDPKLRRPYSSRPKPLQEPSNVVAMKLVATNFALESLKRRAWADTTSASFIKPQLKLSQAVLFSKKTTQTPAFASVDGHVFVENRKSERRDKQVEKWARHNRAVGKIRPKSALASRIENRIEAYDARAEVVARECPFEVFARVVIASKAHVRDVHREFDTDEDGVLSYEELHRMLHKMNFDFTLEEVTKICTHMDEDSDGYLTREEFARFVSRFDGRLSASSKKNERKKNDPLYLLEVKNKIAGRSGKQTKKKKVLIAKSTVGDDMFDAFGW